ncbi:MAG: pyrroline-5-carboxylate reductase [Bacteroidales bacterium]|jgi:pyrroline-5-carboxylate reductase|nr:pyrroline-5-carboxylate reductase [Bacteroidales bacterium]
MKLSILGAGNMGGAIARGLAKSKIVSADNLTVSDCNQETLDRLTSDVPGIHTTRTNLEACEGASIVIFCVKPWLVQQVVEEVYPAIKASNPIIICIAAGVTFQQLTSFMAGDQRPMTRAIPNTAISIRQSPTLLCFNEYMEEAQKSLVKAIFDELGTAIILDEAHMAAGTAITSCGIAYVFQFIKASMQGAIELGFYPHVAKQMIDQTVLGAVNLLEQNGTMPDTEIYKVCTPGGITIKGLNEMTKEGFDNAVIQGLKKAAGK